MKEYQVNWEWSTTELFHCPIGKPSELIDRLTMGEYEPNVTEGAKRSAIAKFKTATKHQKKLLEELEHDPGTLMYLDLNFHTDAISFLSLH